MPLMSDWAASLAMALDAEIDGLAKCLGLDEPIEGDEFESRLGAFLAFQSTALPLVGRFRGLGLAPITVTTRSGVDEWADRARQVAGQAVETIRGNLYQNFGSKRFDAGLAHDAYEGLRGRIVEPDGSTFLAFATTNYDHCIETALRTMGLTVLDGLRAAREYATPTLDPLRLADEWLQTNSRAPVLHLHGAVGRYQRGDGHIIAPTYPDLPYNETFGSPALLLPDPEKSATSLSVRRLSGTSFVASSRRPVMCSCSVIP